MTVGEMSLNVFDPGSLNVFDPRSLNVFDPENKKEQRNKTAIKNEIKLTVFK